MPQLSDIEIAQQATLRPISEIAAQLGLTPERLEPYGHYKAKVDLGVLDDNEANGDGKLVLTTALTPTPAGEGKTTTTVGLGDALRRLGVRAAVALREPSLGPVFGIKGGAAGGGYSQVLPMEDINLHFTGDIHAVGSANNLLAAMVDNHIFQGNALGFDQRRITWRRALDMNDRHLRQMVGGLGGVKNGVPREDGFDITVASEVMAILCLSRSLEDLKTRLGRIVAGYTWQGQPITAGQLQAAGAMASLLREAIKPNLVQTLEGTPAFVHGGPFANIAHGCNSLTATRMALKLVDVLVTEAGFGADLGAEKFFNIKARAGNLHPDAVVIVASIRALKYNGGLNQARLKEESPQAVEAGLENLMTHADNITGEFGLPAVVALNSFPDDSASEEEVVRRACAERKLPLAFSEVWARGGAGGAELAQTVLQLFEQDNSRFSYLYSLHDSLKAKVEAIARKLYRAGRVDYSAQAETDLAGLEALGYGRLPVCMAKTQASITDDPAVRGAPRDFTLTVQRARVAAGAGFVVVYTGNIMTMPGLPRTPAAEAIDILPDGRIQGLF